MVFRDNLEGNLFKIQEKLKTKTYSFGPYHTFIVTEPKTRRVESASFSDKIVHHSIFSCLEPIYEPKFFTHSYACRPGRGTHRAMMTLGEWISCLPQSFFLKCDIRKYFASVNREKLFEIIEKTIGDPNVLALLNQLIFHAPGSGIPIGNLTSQLFANIYLNELDNYVKRQLQVGQYIRYMDDFVVLSESREQALLLKNKIKDYVFEVLKLELSPEKVLIAPVKKGVPFVGFLQTPRICRVRSQSLRRIQKKVTQAFDKTYMAKYRDIDIFSDKFWTQKENKHTLFYGSWSSYLGHIQYTDSHDFLITQMLNRLDCLQVPRRSC